jgi:hypothetical protein
VKIGTESRVKTWVAIALAIIALVLLFYNFVGSGSQPSQTAAAPRRTEKTKGNLISSLDPTLRTDLLRTSQETKYEGKGRNIFQAGAEPLPQPTTPVVQKTAPPVVQGPPQPPPIDMKFIGFAKEAGQQKKIFLVQNNDVFVAGEGDIVNRRYKVLKINQNSVEIEDVLNNNRQSIPLTQS